MAMYHFRTKSDKKPNGSKVSAIKHVEYIIEKRHMKIAAAVFFILIICRNGHTMTKKNFSKQPINTKVKEIADTWRLNLPCRMN